MTKLRLTAMAFGTILAVIPSDATAQIPGSKPSTRAVPAQPVAEWRKKRAVARNPSPLTSATAAAFKNLAAKGDFSMSALQDGTFYKFWAGYTSKGKASAPQTIVSFKCKVKTEPSNTPGAWLDHPCQPVLFSLKATFAEYGISVPVPEPAPFQQQFLKLMGFQVEATIDPDKQVPEWFETNNTASLTWE